MSRSTFTWIPALVLSAGVSFATPSPVPNVTFRGESGGDEDSFGWALAPAGDVNHDGQEDLIVGAPTNDHLAGFAGRAYLFLGPFPGGQINAADADAIVNAEAFGDNLGVAACGAGDVNADGFDDLLVGARGHDQPGIQSGRAYLFHGPVSGNVGLAQADAVISGLAFEELGWSVAAGDMNGDHRSDLLIGANKWNSSVGRAYVFYGPIQGARSSTSADAIINGVLISDYLGSAVAVADVNGDTIDDAIVSAPHEPIEVSSPGFTYVFFGPLAGEQGAAAADVVVRGEINDDRFGIAVSAGDVNGDDAMDLVVGADDIHGSSPGKAYLFLGPLAGNVFAAAADAEITGEAPDDVFGCAVSAGGDANGDGFSDVLAGAWDNQAGGIRAGRAYVFLGPFSGSFSAASADRIVTGGGFGDRVGYAVSWVGDLDGSGRDDAFLGAPQFAEGAPGEAYLYFDADVVSDIPNLAGIPRRITLYAPFPNPSLGTVSIDYEAAAESPIQVTLYDVQGREIRRLFEGNASPNGGRLIWDGRSRSGLPAPPGLYFCRLVTGGVCVQQKLLRLD